MNITKKELILKMKTCFQIEGKLSILDHGIMVFLYSKDLINVLRTNQKSKYNQEIPSFIIEHKDKILKNLADSKTLKMYTIYHDCGKPFCVPDD